MDWKAHGATTEGDLSTSSERDREDGERRRDLADLGPRSGETWDII